MDKRISPEESATLFEQGIIKPGNNKELWVVKQYGPNKRWVPCISANINNIQMLTVDYLAKNIGKEIKIFSTGYDLVWPKKIVPNLIFTPSGNAQKGKNKKKLINWLKTQDPEIKDRTVFFILGTITYLKTNGIDDFTEESGLQVDSLNKQIVSTNLWNSILYVKNIIKVL